MSGRILAGFLVLLLLMVAGAAEPTRVVPAEEILKKIEMGLPVESYHVIPKEVILKKIEQGQGWRVESSREVAAEEILKKIELGQVVKYNDCKIVGDMNMNRLNLPRVPAERNMFEKKYLGINDYEIIIASPITISDSVIEGSVNLNGTAFQNVNFRGTKFEGPVFLVCSRFNRVDFRNTRFNQEAYFWKTQFNQRADFQHAQFNQNATFQYAQFNQNAFFPDTQFNQNAYFQHAQFNHFASFSNAQVAQESHFEDAGFLNVFFNNSQFSKDAFFQGAKINGTLSLYRTKYDTLNIRWSSIHDLAYDDTAYHLLIQNFNKLGLGDDASECQYSYRCKHREELWRQHKFDLWLFDLLAWATYGYGLRPVRPLGWGFLFILVGGLFFFLTGSAARSKETPPGKKPLALRKREEKPEGNVSIWEALLLSATYFTSGASSIISATHAEIVPLGRGRYVVVLLRLLGWIFFVIFLSALTKAV